MGIVKNGSMDIVRGLDAAIVEFNSRERRLVVKVAKRLQKNGFPILQLTRVHVQKSILTDQDYYSDNEISFLINPGVYRQDQFNWGIERIGIGWEDPSVIKTPDGGMEFNVGHKPNPEDLVMNLYGLQDSSTYGALLEDHDVLIKELDKAIIGNPLAEIKDFTSRELFRLMRNYYLVITAVDEKHQVFEVATRRMDHDMIDSDHFHGVFEQYRLKIDLSAAEITIMHRFDPTFFPTPSCMPNRPCLNE